MILLRTKGKDKTGTVSAAGWSPDRPGRVDSFRGLTANFYSLKTNKIPAGSSVLGDWRAIGWALEWASCLTGVRKLGSDDQQLLARIPRGSGSFGADLGSGLRLCGLGARSCLCDLGGRTRPLAYASQSPGPRSTSGPQTAPIPSGTGACLPLLGWRLCRHVQFPALIVPLAFLRPACLLSQREWPCEATQACRQSRGKRRVWMVSHCKWCLNDPARGRLAPGGPVGSPTSLPGGSITSWASLGAQWGPLLGGGCCREGPAAKPDHTQCRGWAAPFPWRVERKWVRRGAEVTFQLPKP